MYGVGLLVALQRNVFLSPSSIVWSRGVVVKLSGTVKHDINMFSKESGFHLNVDKLLVLHHPRYVTG